jgi:hypothetical protein
LMEKEAAQETAMPLQGSPRGGALEGRCGKRSESPRSASAPKKRTPRPAQIQLYKTAKPREEVLTVRALCGRSVA